MNNSIHELVLACSTDRILTPQQLQKIDQLTHSYGASLQSDKMSICNQVWHSIQQSQKFWQNISLLITYSKHDETKLQVYVLIFRRVRNNWYYEDHEVRTNMKKYLCAQASDYGTIKPLSPAKVGLFRKINQIIVEILKYEWMGEWCNFLCEICQAIYTNQIHAQNYFHLLSEIFEQIFSQQQKLTSQQVSKIREQISFNYKQIAKTFEKYLNPQTQTKILKNALLAFDGLISLVPAFYLFFGVLVDRIVEIVDCGGHMVAQALECLCAIIQTQGDAEGYADKICEKKRQVITHILQSESLRQNPISNSKILASCLSFVSNRHKQLPPPTQPQCQPHSLKFFQQNHQILRKLVGWINENNIQQEKQSVIRLYRFIITVIGQDDVDAILQQIIWLSPCPINSQFWVQQGLFEDSHQEGSIDQICYSDIMKNLINNQQQQYFKYFLTHFNGEFSSDKRSLQKLTKLTWNFYYYIEIYHKFAVQAPKLKQKIFTIIYRLLALQQKLQKFQNQIQINNVRQINSLAKYAGCLKIGVCVVLSNPVCLGFQIFCEAFVRYVTKGFCEGDKFVKGIIEVLMISFNGLPIQYVYKIQQQWIHAMKNRKNNQELNKRYLKVLRKWETQKQQNIAYSLSQSIKRRKTKWQLINQILQPHTVKILQIQKLNIQKFPPQKITELQRALSCALLDWLKLVAVIIEKHNQSQNSNKQPCLLLFQNKDVWAVIEIVKQAIVLVDLTGDFSQAIEFLQLAFIVFVAILRDISNQQLSKNSQSHLQSNLQLISYILGSLYSEPTPKLSQQAIYSLLTYTSQFVRKLSVYTVPQPRKLEILQLILNKIYSTPVLINHNTPGYVQFLDAVVRSKRLHKLSSGVVSSTLAKVFVMLGEEDFIKVQKGLEALKWVFGETIASKQYEELLFPYILDCITTIYIVVTKVKQIKYFQEYKSPNLLFLSLVYTKNLSMCINQGQQTDQPELKSCSQRNQRQVYRLLTRLNRKLFPTYTEHFYMKLDNFLVELMRLVDVGKQADFVSKAKDFVVVVRRGY